MQNHPVHNYFGGQNIASQILIVTEVQDYFPVHIRRKKARFNNVLYSVRLHLDIFNRKCGQLS